MPAYYNEYDPYAAQWLRNLIAAGHIAPGEVDERSILDVQPDDLLGFTQCHFFAGIGGWSLGARMAGWPDDKPLWTGSCPCQPFSVAGSQKGQADERHLWPVFFALISSRRPDVVMGEQVAAAVGKDWLDGVHTDLESIAYACGAAVVPACAVDAPHRRDRLWFVADAASDDERRERQFRTSRGSQIPVGGLCDAGALADTNEPSQGQGREQRSREFGWFGGNQVACNIDVDHAKQPRLEGQPRHGDDSDQPGWFDPQQIGPVASTSGSLSNTEGSSESDQLKRAQPGYQGRPVVIIGSEPRASSGSNDRADASRGSNSARSQSPWASAEWAIGADGKARRVEPGIRLLAHGVPARVGKLRAYGNAIVPEVAEAIAGAYLDVERAAA